MKRTFVSVASRWLAGITVYLLLWIVPLLIMSLFRKESVPEGTLLQNLYETVFWIPAIYVVYHTYLYGFIHIVCLEFWYSESASTLIKRSTIIGFVVSLLQAADCFRDRNVGFKYWQELLPDLAPYVIPAMAGSVIGGFALGLVWAKLIRSP